jgi:peptidoglycan/LPS O-acetylase OafA/YrhL
MSEGSRATVHPNYRPDVDGLRAVAVLAVMGFHAFPRIVRGGFIGVDIFFVISGYLISTIIFANLARDTFSYLEFYNRRIRRIFPALLIVLTACFVFAWFALLADEFAELSKHIAGGAGFLSNFLLWKESGYFDTSAETKPLLHLWSLGIEEQFLCRLAIASRILHEEAMESSRSDVRSSVCCPSASMCSRRSRTMSQIFTRR